MGFSDRFTMFLEKIGSDEFGNINFINRELQDLIDLSMGGL